MKLRIAGSIDFCVTDATGSLALTDWKRSSNLQEKYTSLRNMLPPWDHVPDCAGFHCRLQLNMYKYLIQKYYGSHVSRMLVAEKPTAAFY